MTLKDVIDDLKAVGVETPSTEALDIISHITGEDEAAILAKTELTLDRPDSDRLKELIQQRNQQPLAYLTGRRQFWGRDFSLNRNVLIPRPESEAMIELAQELMPTKPSWVYDVGSGSGCLGLSYCLDWPPPPPKLTLIDNSRAALAVAAQNCRDWQIDANLKYEDIRHMTPGKFKPGSLVLANLPYLDADRKQAAYDYWPQLRAEPSTSLFAPDGGLGLYRHLFAKLKGRPALVVCEALAEQQTRLIQIGDRHGYRLSKKKGLGLGFTPSI